MPQFRQGGQWYDPATGRWQTQDPLGFGGGDSNLYRYVSNTPSDQTDPSGLQPEPPPFTINLPRADQLQFYAAYLQTLRPLQDQEIAALLYVFATHLQIGDPNVNEILVIGVAAKQVEAMAFQSFLKNGAYGVVARALPWSYQVLIRAKIAELDSANYDTRQQAVKCLESLGALPVDLLVNTQYQSLEQKRRVEKLLTGIYSKNSALRLNSIDTVMGRIMKNLTRKQRETVISEMSEDDGPPIFVDWAKRAAKANAP